MGKLIVGDRLMINYSKLKDIREDNDISQEEIAKFLGIPRSTYSMWEIGISIIPLPYLCKLSDYFNFSVDYILGLTNNRSNKSLIKGFDIKTLGNNLKEIRLKNQLSQENIADILGVKQPCIYKYEKGIICISTSNIYKFSKEFKISINEICGKGKISK
jgi:transcriptional regulator with XRE-family HTH domain